MGIPGSANPMLFGGAAAYQINQSLRFDGSEYLSWTPSSSGNYQTWTVSTWIKNCTTSDSSTRGIFGVYTHSFLQLYYANQLIQVWDGAASQGQTSAYFRDPSAWYHILYKCNSNSLELYVNNQLVFGPDATSNSGFNRNLEHVIGRGYDTAGFKGFIAEHHQIDGQALTPSSFGETDTITGAWIPKKYSGSYGTNGFYLKFNPSATNGIGHDHSGNGNNFTATGFSTSGTGTDVMSDTPTNNWCTLNPLANGGTLANGNLQFSTGASHALAKSTFAIPASGLWYAEATVSTLTSATVAAGFGLGTAALSNTAVASLASGAWEIYSSDLRYFNRNGTQTNIAGTFAANDVLQVAVDMANSRAWVGVNNTWYNGTNGTTGDPGAGTNPTLTSLPSELFIIANTYSNTLSLNFGQRTFAYTPPTGFKALNTANLPEPTIKKGNAHFNTILYTGNGSTQSITGVGFQPDFLWLKNRNSSNYYHALADSVRGATKALASNSTEAERTSDITSINSDGFSLQFVYADATHSENQNTQPYVAWSWKANGAGSSNTAGTITSTVSANASAGFSIVTYTGDGSGTATIGHGLGVKPKMVIVKSRSNSSTYWTTYHEDVSAGTNYFMELNTSSGRQGGSGADTFFGASQTFNSTVFSVGYPGAASNSTNVNTYTYVAYCFSEVAGYSKFGSYTGNGSSDGPFVFCGFKPKWVMIKTSNAANEWVVLDTARDTYNVAEKRLVPNSSSAELTNVTNMLDVLSNGFKIRTTDGRVNTTVNYIFAAFAELPFKYANAR